MDATRTRAICAATLSPGAQSLLRSIAGPDQRILNRVVVVGFSVQALSTQAQYALLLLTPIALNARGWEAGPIGIVPYYCWLGRRSLRSSWSLGLLCLVLDSDSRLRI